MGITQIPITPQVHLRTKDNAWFAIHTSDGTDIGHFVLEEDMFTRPSPTEKCAIWDFRLDKTFQRGGLGSKIYQTIEHQYLRPHCASITLSATPNGKPFWQKMGFTQRFPTSTEFMIKKF